MKRKAKRKPKYTHKGVLLNYNKQDEVVFLRKTAKRWIDQYGRWYDVQGLQLGWRNCAFRPTGEIDLTTVSALEDL